MSVVPAAPPSVIRSSWSVWPRTRAESNTLEVPLGLIYTPFAEQQEMQAVYYEPLRCRQNNAILNPLCNIDFKAKVWHDPFSGARTAFPSHYAQQMTESMLPAELQYTTIDYLNQGLHPALGPGGTAAAGMGVRPPVKPTFCFVVDLATYTEELETLKESLQQAISLLPSDSQVGLITYAGSVYVHELGFPHCVKCYVFRGNKDIQQSDLSIQLRLPKGHQGANPAMNATSGAAAGQMYPGGASTGGMMNGGAPAGGIGGVSNRFMCPLDQIDMKLSSIIDELKCDTGNNHLSSEYRPARCTGAALSAAVGLMEMHCHQQPGRIILFTGGICTVGPGAIADQYLSKPIRQHQHLQKETSEAQMSKDATTYYTGLAQRAVQSGHTIDAFASALDQTGIHEMRVMCERTGGLCIMSDTFSLNVFKDSLRELCDQGGKFSAHAYNVRIELITSSKDIKIAGCIGCCTSTKKKSSSVSESTSVGEGNTCEWVCGAMDSTSSLAFYLDVVNTNSANAGTGAGSTYNGRSRYSYIQIQCSFTHYSGDKRLRVHTIAFPFLDSANTSMLQQLGQGFDQEAATLLMARLAVSRADTELSVDILRWLDRKLIRLCSQFGDFEKDTPDSFQLGHEFAFYPCFMFHLRRSPLLDTFNSSPDETAFYRICLLKENLMNSITMISPSLQCYTLDSTAPVPCLLDSKALKNDVVLLMDSYFHIIVWQGELIHQWKEQGYHHQPQYENLRKILENPITHANNLLKSRIPAPKFVNCHSGGSQERFLLARVNPSMTHRQQQQLEQNAYAASASGEANSASILTEDVSMKTFMDHLIRLSVSS